MAQAIPSVDDKQFWSRLKKIYKFWESGRSGQLSNVDVVMSVSGSAGDIAYCKTMAIQMWLFNRELPDFIMILSKTCIAFFGSTKKVETVRQVEKSPHRMDNVKMKFFYKTKDGELQDQLEPVLETLKQCAMGNPIGMFSKERPSGAMVDTWKVILKGADLTTVDVTVPFGLLMAVKDESEVAKIRMASDAVCTFFIKYLKPQIVSLIEADKVVTHAMLSSACLKALQNPKYLPNVDASKLDFSYPPIIQSGGNYSLKYSVISDDHNLDYGVIICSFGLRYAYYCSNMSRTLLVNPSAEVEQVYTLLCNVQQKAIETMKPGVKLCEVYEAALDMVKEANPTLLPLLTKNLGFGLGVDFREGALLINANNSVQLEEGMVFNLNAGFSGVAVTDGESKTPKTISLFVADTVLVEKNGCSSLTEAAKKRFKNISVYLAVDDEEPEDESTNNENIEEYFGRGKRSVVLQDQLRSKENGEERRKEHQKELVRLLNERARDRLALSKNQKSSQKVRRAAVAYKSMAQFPKEKEVSGLRFYVDKQHESVIMPICGSPVAFHISVMKNISMSTEGDFTYLRINFFHPGVVLTKEAPPAASASDSIYVKEMTFRSTNLREPGELNAPSTNLITASRLIKDLQKTYRAKEAEEREKEGIVKQDTLILNTTKALPRLKDLYIRPSIFNRRMVGTLEAHANGFRYNSYRGDRVDVLYQNVKHAFFQPCDHEMIVLIHLHLKNAILFGKRKHVDVQFFTEVGEITTDLGKRGPYDDRDDMHVEQAERELRQKLNLAFKTFCDRVEKLTERELEFDTPLRDLGFYGVPFRSSVLLQPTSCCLVNLTEWPPFVLTLDDVELVHFERVQFNLKNFDMVIIFKDYSRKPFSVSAIPMDVMDHVKEWLDSCDIPFSEGVQSLNWPKIMKSITDDPEGFFESGGWDFLTSDQTESEEEVEDAGKSDDEDFEVEDEESSEEDSDEDYESEQSSESEAASVESGLSWSDMEEETRKEEKEKLTGQR